MKKNKIIFGLIFLLLIIMFSNVVFGFSLDNVISSAKDWTNTSSGDGNVKKISNTGYEEANKIAGALTIIGIFAVAIIGITLGIKYMLAGGVEQKAAIKKTMMPWLIGAVIILGALLIWKNLVGFLDDLI